MKKLYNQVTRSEWRESEIAMPVIARYGTGGGNVPIVLQRRFSNIMVQDTEIAPTIEAGGGEGGNNLPMILYEANVCGTLSPGAHPGSYNGQDAWNDMLVTDDGTIMHGNRTSKCRNHEGG